METNPKKRTVECEPQTRKQDEQAALNKAVLMIVGVLAVGLGAVGIFVPLLPTTPLLLLAAACFVRSSDRLYGWLLHHRWFGTYIRNYREHRAVPLRIKITSLVLLWSTMGFSAFHVVESTWLRVLMFLIATGVTIHIVRLKTLSQ